MKKTTKKLVVAFLGGLLGTGQYAFAIPNNATGGNVSGSKNTTGAVVVPVIEQSISKGFPLLLRERGDNTFSVVNTTTPQLVVDESSGSVVNGLLTGVDVSSSPSGGCFVQVFDSGSAVGFNASYDPRAIIPPVISSGTTSTYVQFAIPHQFNNGLVVTVSAANCTGFIHYSRMGTKD